MAMMFDFSFYSGKRVFVTGHTGFKGSWLCFILDMLGADVSGYSLSPERSPNLYEIAGIESRVNSTIGDVRDLNCLQDAVLQAQPEIVFHLAAQPIVLDSYKEPVYTYETNVMGTVNLLEAVRKSDSVRSVLNVTTDKVYLNKEIQNYAYKEDDFLDGYDPYSNSKSCSELVTHSYRDSFLKEKGVAVYTARAGNVIGGGDFSPHRIIPDCMRSLQSEDPLLVRNPYSTRPYQHVLEPLFAYLEIAARYDSNGSGNCDLGDAYNIGPDFEDCVTTGEIVDLFAKHWGPDFEWTTLSNDVQAPHEASFLQLDSRKLRDDFGWKPVWHIDEAVGKTVEWIRAYIDGDNVSDVMTGQIEKWIADRG